MPVVVTTSFGAAGTAPGLPEWDPLKTGAELTLSNGNLTATHSGPNAWRTTLTGLSHTTGKKYWELTVNVLASSQHVMIGAQSDAVPPGLNFNTFVGGGNRSFGWQSNTSAGQGDLWRNNVQINLLFSEYGQGDVVMIAHDIDNGNAWFGKNGTWAQGDPGTDTSPPVTSLDTVGPWYAGFSAFSATNQGTANFGGTAFAHSIPAGYTAYNVP